MKTKQQKQLEARNRRIVNLLYSSKAKCQIAKKDIDILNEKLGLFNGCYKQTDSYLHLTDYPSDNTLDSIFCEALTYQRKEA